MKKNLAFFCTLIIMAGDTFSATETVGGYTYTYNLTEGKATIFKNLYTPAISPNPSGTITIPSILGGCPVVALGNSAVFNCQSLSSLTMPDSVTSIGDYAFYQCLGLTSIGFSTNVTSIGVQAFKTCSSLSTINLPKNLITISDAAFFECTGLSSIVIPDKVQTIGDRAFAGCSSMTTAKIGSSVSYIAQYGFGWCANLHTVYFRGNKPGGCSDIYAQVGGGTSYVPFGSTGWVIGDGLSTHNLAYYTLSKVNFNGNGYTSGTEPEAISEAAGTVLTLPVFGTLSKTGYTLGGWNTQSNGSGINYAESASLTIPSTNATLYIKWVPNTYTVTYNANGGTGSMPISTFTYEVLSNLTINAFTRNGYSFTGWTNALGVAYTNGALVNSLISSGNVNLYATWTLNPYYVVNGANATLIGITSAVSSDVAHSGDGLNSIKLGGIGLLADGQMAGIEWSATGPGILAFDWKVSSEEDYDWLSFYEAGIGPTNQISGTVDWNRRSVTVTGASDLNHTFRWEYEKDPEGYYVGEDCGWVDAISWTPLYAMTVNSGSGDGYYTNNAYASIMADTAATHYEFDRWTGDTNTVANILAASTTMRMSITNAIVTATYKPILYTLSASNASGGGTYPYATTVEIRASAFENKRFLCWTGDVTSVANVNAATTTVVTSDHTISLTATYSVPLTVNSGTGSGWYPEGATANVYADADPMWKEFLTWTGDVGLLSNANARTTALTLQTAPATVTATYKDSIARLTGSYGRTYTESGTAGAITIDATAGSPSGTPAVKLGGAGVIPDNGFAAFETVVSGSGSILFQWKVSSELNGDYLKFKVDGSEVAAISGTRVPWTQVSNRVETAGSHTLRWEYVKNGASASNIDAGWVDDIVWIGDVPTPALTPVIVQATLTNQNMEIQFTGERGMTYLIQTNGTLDHSGWSDYQTLQPMWINESNGVHRFEIVPSALGPDTLFYRVVTPATNAPPSVPFVMVAIPAGTNSGTDPDFGAYSLTVEAFYMDATEVTKAKWDEVYIWAVAQGYSFTNAGLGKASSHPVHTVDWYDCVKWCNARSQKEGKTPCYNLSDWSCNFSANGYRLPTETEWEYAARGGLSSKRFPWGDIIDHTWANYCGYPSSFPYDQGYGGYDTRYATGGEPYTSPVGAFAPNGYGLYDMAGNIWEWCSDASGSDLDFRGGGWDVDAGGARSRYTYWYYPPSATRTDLGFRTVRR